MEDGIFVGGEPARITATDFRRHHLDSFPALCDDETTPAIEEAIEAVYAMFSGVGTLWNYHPPTLWWEKTTLCYRLLVAWYITDMFPTLAAGGGGVTMGGIPLKKKDIGPVSITFQDLTSKGDLLGSLQSNSWGNKAYLMLKSAGKRFLIGGKKYV
jgi:hypothetical protein